MPTIVLLLPRLSCGCSTTEKEMEMGGKRIPKGSTLVMNVTVRG